MFSICRVVIIRLVGVKKSIVYWFYWYVYSIVVCEIFVVFFSGVMIGKVKIVSFDDDGMMKLSKKNMISKDSIKIGLLIWEMIFVDLYSNVLEINFLLRMWLILCVKLIMREIVIRLDDFVLKELINFFLLSLFVFVVVISMIIIVIVRKDEVIVGNY